MTGQDEQDEEPGNGGRGRYPAPELDVSQLRGIPLKHAARHGEHEEGEQQQDRRSVQQPFENDGGEGCRGVQTLLFCEKVGSNDLTGTGRQEETGGKADDRRPERVTEMGRADRREKCLPPPGAQGVGQSGDQNRQGEQPRIGPAGFGPHLGKVGVPEEKGEERHGAQENEDRADPGSHGYFDEVRDYNRITVPPSLWENVSYCS